MESITSKRHVGNFYLSLIFGSMFFIFIGALVLGIAKHGLPPAREALVFALGIATLVFAIYAPIRYFKNVPIVKVTNDFIEFNGEKYYWTEIEAMQLTGKQRFKFFLMPSFLEGAVFKFTDGSVKYMYDGMYANSWQIKSFIQREIVEKKKSAVAKSDNYQVSNLDIEQFEYFKGSPFFSFRGLMLWGFILVLLTLPSRYDNPRPEGYIGIGFFSLFWFLLHSIFMNYFGISEHYFIVQNHNFFWKRKMFELRNIREVVFETSGKQPNSLRVIAMDYQTQLFKAGTLNSEKWRDLKSAFEIKGINVRNEIGI